MKILDVLPYVERTKRKPFLAFTSKGWYVPKDGVVIMYVQGVNYPEPVQFISTRYLVTPVSEYEFKPGEDLPVRIYLELGRGPSG